MVKYKHIDRDQLEILYRENLSLTEIASVLSVSQETISKAIDFHKIPKRKHPGAGNGAVENSRTREMAELYRSGLSLEEVGEKFGLTRQGVRYRFMQAGINRRRKPKLVTIDKDRLEKFYLEEKLSIVKIASFFNVSKPFINHALEFYKIPKRSSINKGGYLVNSLRSLKIGEKKEIKIRSKGYGGIYTTAKRLGIKVSVRSRGVKFEITRVGRKRILGELKM
jgi:predicted DNA-binding protein YlxM (UPF0122 family)